MKELIQQLVRKKQPRYITKVFIIKTYGVDFYNNILERTSYLSQDVKIPERLFNIVHDIKELPKCMHCGTIIKKPYFHKFDTDPREYLTCFCNDSCMRSYRFDMNSSLTTINYDKKNIDKVITNLTFDKIKKQPWIMEEIKAYLYSLIGDDYRRMNDLEALYFIKNDLKCLPRCPVTNEYVDYRGSGKYFKHFSYNASANNPETKERREKTVKEKYGVDNVSKCKKILKKIKDTNIEKYGVDHYCKTDEYKQRLENGDIERKPLSPEMIYKLRRVNHKRAWEKILSFKNEVMPLFTFDEYVGCGFKPLYRWKCVKSDKEFIHWYHNGKIPNSPYLYNGTNIEKIIDDYLQKNNISFQRNNRSIIPPYELDFYLPDHKLAIECNGLYWHSEKALSRRNNDIEAHEYHIMKTNLCKEKDIKLLQLFSDELVCKTLNIFSILDSLLQINKRNLCLSKCNVKEISYDVSNKFLNKYNLKSSSASDINLGLYYNRHLVSVMTFSKYIDKYKLIDYSRNFHFNIIGGAERLLKFFEDKYKPKAITTCVDLRLDDGKSLYDLGFNVKYTEFPTYYYTKNYLERYFKDNLDKDKIDNYDPILTEWENMKNNGWDRIWDCGNMVFEKNYER